MVMISRGKHRSAHFGDELSICMITKTPWSFFKRKMHLLISLKLKSYIALSRAMFCYIFLFYQRRRQLLHLFVMYCISFFKVKMCNSCIEYFNTSLIVHDERILLLDRLIFKSLAQIDKLKIWKIINIYSQ